MAQGMTELSRALAALPEVRELLLDLDAGRCPAAVSGLSGVHRAQLAAAIRQETQRPLLVVCADESEASRMAADLNALLGLLGFVLGTAAGTLIAVALWWSPALNRVLDPYLVVLNALPKIALGPILIVWFGAGITSIIVMALLISFVVTIMSVLAGFNEITGEKQLLMKTLGASKLQIFTMVVLPASLPTIMNALKISVGMSWVGVIVGEYLVSKAGLGYLIVYGGQVFKLDLVMASIVVLCLLAALMYYGVAYMEKKLVKWRMHGG